MQAKIWKLSTAKAMNNVAETIYGVAPAHCNMEMKMEEEDTTCNIKSAHENLTQV